MMERAGGSERVGGAERGFRDAASGAAWRAAVAQPPGLMTRRIRRES
jgi:hypothetical protein